jgi:hypothetical protein
MKKYHLKMFLNNQMKPLLLMKLIGLLKELLLQLKTKVNVDHAGLSQPPEN